MTIWYVRPDTSHSGTRNGTTYATAWGDWANIVWGGAGVVAGDTLYVCGPHVFTASRSVGAHGGTLGNECIIRGDYEADPGSITLNGAYTLTLRDHTFIRGLAVTQGTASALFISGHTNVAIEDGEFTGTANVPFINASTAMGVNTASIALRRNTFNRVGYAFRWLATTATATTATIDGLICEDNSVTNHPSNTGSVGGFEVRMEPGVDAACVGANIRFSRNSVSGPGRAFVVASGGGPPPDADKFNNVTFEDNTAEDVDVGFLFYGSTSGNRLTGNTVRRTTGLSGGADIMECGGLYIAENDFDGHTSVGVDGNSLIIGDGCDGVICEKNKLGGAVGGATVNSGAALMLNACSNVKVRSNLLRSSRYGVWVADNSDNDGWANLEVTGNTILATEVLLYVRNFSLSLVSADELTFKNNACIGTGSTTSVLNDYAASPVEDYNAFWQVGAADGHTLGANDVLTAPVLSADFRPQTGSALIEAGIHAAYTTDLDGRQRNNPPTIGAYEAPVVRSAASAREPRE